MNQIFQLQSYLDEDCFHIALSKTSKHKVVSQMLGDVCPV